MYNSDDLIKNLHIHDNNPEAIKSLIETSNEPQLWACVDMIIQYSPTPPEYRPSTANIYDEIHPIALGFGAGTYAAMELAAEAYQSEVDLHLHYHPQASKLKKVLLGGLQAQTKPTIHSFNRPLTQLIGIGSASRITKALLNAKEYDLLVGLYQCIPPADAIADMLIDGDRSILVSLIQEKQGEKHVKPLLDHCFKDINTLSRFIFERKITHKTGGGTTRPLSRTLLNKNMHTTLIELYCKLPAVHVIPDLLMEGSNSVLATLAKTAQKIQRPEGSLQRLEKVIDHCLTETTCLRSWISSIPWEALGAIDPDRMDKLRALAPATQEPVRFSLLAAPTRIKEFALTERAQAAGSKSNVDIE